MANTVHAAEYASDFDFDSERSSQPDASRIARPDSDLDRRLTTLHASKGHQSLVVAEYSREEWRKTRLDFMAMDAYDRHKKMVNDYMRYYGGSMQDFARDGKSDKRDLDIVHENHQFLWDNDGEKLSWEQRVAKRYWDKLYKEYCIADLSLYKENKIAMRWRVKKEVISGKGQFVCGNKKCSSEESLRSWEVNFGYVEHGQKKNALIKLRLCPPCSYKLNYCRTQKEVKKKRSKRRREKEEGNEEASGSETAKKRARKEEEAGSEEKKEEVVAADIWSRPVEVTEDKTVEEEIDDYLEAMFL